MKFVPRSLRHRALWPTGLVLLLGCGGAGDGFPNGLEAESVQMHIHGHSHHNGDARPGSMQWHSHFAAATDLDVLWWSDHSEMFDLRTPLEIEPSRNDSPAPPPSRQALRQAVRAADAVGHRIALIKAPEADVEWMQAREAGPSGGLRLAARSTGEETTFEDRVWAVRGAGGAPRGFLLPRPVSSGAILALDLELLEWGPNARLDILVGLSWHHRGKPEKHALRYRLTADPAAEKTSISNRSRALIPTQLPSGRGRVVLDLEKDAELLQDGGDNTITSVQFRLAARAGASASVEIHGLELSSRRPEPEHQLARLRGFAAAYEEEYGHAQHVGVEFLSGPDGGVHLNAFLPDRAVTGDLVAGSPETWDDPEAFVRLVHEAGGVVTLNHIFGPSIGASKPRRQERLSKKAIAELLQNRAYGADILEVGYLGRGGVDLEHHLETWDRLTAAGLLTYGNGVSDAHGGAWGPAMLPNPFVTWVWSSSREPEDLIEGLKRGRMVFGDPFSYRGRLYFHVGSAQMGDRAGLAKRPQRLRIAVDGDFDAERHQIFLVQGRIEKGKGRTEYLSSTGSDHRRPVAPDENLSLDTSRPTFVRLELWSVDGKPLRFTNPIVFGGESES